jgi:hypothetical protein
VAEGDKPKPIKTGPVIKRSNGKPSKKAGPELKKT